MDFEIWHRVVLAQKTRQGRNHVIVQTKAEFKALREMLGVSRRQLAEHCGVSVQTVTHWESTHYRANAPRAAWDMLYGLEIVQGCDVARVAAEGEDVTLTYRLDDDSDEARMHNATMRRMASALMTKGVRVRWANG